MKQHSAALSFLAMATACVLIQPVQAQVPAITSLTPGSGPVGTNRHNCGETNFDATAANDIVAFGGVTASVLSAATNSLTVAVPLGATFSPLTVTADGLVASTGNPLFSLPSRAAPKHRYLVAGGTR